MEVQVEYEYVAQEPDELSLRKGDIITNVIQKLDGWWEGELGSKRGLFPDNFVKVIGSSESQSAKEDEVFTETVQLRKKPCNRKLKALFSYSPEQDDELTLQVGDIIDFISEVEDGWWKGSLNGRTGIFPSNFVDDMAASSTNGTAGDPNKLETKQSDKNRATFIVRGGTQDSPADSVNTDEEPAPKLPPKPVPRPSYNSSASFTFLESLQESNINDAFLVVTNTNTIDEETSEPHCLAYENMSMQRGEMSADRIEYIRNYSEDSFGGGDSKASLCSLLHSLHIDDHDISFSEFVEGMPPVLSSPDGSKKKCISLLDMSCVVDDGNHSRLHLHSTPADSAKNTKIMKHSDEYCELRLREVARCFYPYAAQNEDELELQEGDIVTIISKSCEDEGWWRGELRGKTGLFPDNFVKIIPPSELQTSTNTSTTKITAQGEAPIPAAKKEPPPPPADSADGAVGSKSKDVGTKKLTSTREPPSGPPPPKPITPTSPMSSANLGFSYLPAVSVKLTGKKDSLVKRDQLNSSTEDSAGNELTEFNAIERNEKQLNHLTAKRAKAPKRRPPSTLLPRESENEENGLGTSPESPVESPYQNSNALTPSQNGGSPVGNNSSGVNSVGFNVTSTTGAVSEGSNLSTPGSRLSYSRELDNNSSVPSFNSPGNITPTSITPQSAKPKVLPWMDELKKNQEKKRMATSPNPPPTTISPVLGLTSSNIPSAANSVNSSSSPTGMFTSTVIKPKDKEPTSNLPPAVPAKAPPLPAKPVIPPEKSFPTPSANSHATSTPTNVSSTVSTVSMKFGRKTSPSSAMNSNYVNTVISTSTNANSTAANHTSNNHAVPHSNNISKTNSTTDILPNASLHKGLGNNLEAVSYEDYAKLKDRVNFLENELDLVKKQLKLLLDRDGHIV
ncbi:unnamed protein product [Allacma fusca]|uniref:SH3 domain-containing protein n=1 Tax=Allacma fusca TaxID=39272 RepID=A0A8J2LQK0_9HEXA|nr:unnamed protein product [Allacma fusca]